MSTDSFIEGKGEYVGAAWVIDIDRCHDPVVCLGGLAADYDDRAGRAAEHPH